jgi:error-prone DNA polymerase
MYVELHAASAFSFLEGASVPEELAAVCAEQDMAAMAVADHDGVYGAPRFHLAMKKAGMKAHIGSEITVSNFQFLFSSQDPQGLKPDPLKRAISARLKPCPSESKLERNRTLRPCPSENQTPETGNWKPARLPLLVANRAGYQNLCRLVTRMKARGAKDAAAEVIAANEADLEEHARGLICLTGGDDGPLAQALRRGGVEEGKREVERLAGIFGRENVYVELQRHFSRDEEARNIAAVEVARALGLPLVASNGVRHAKAEEREILDVFTCLKHHRTLATAGRLLARNNERQMKSPAEMEKLFADLPEAIANTNEVSARLEFTLADLGYEFPRYPVPDGETMMSFLRQRTQEGFQQRYGRAARDMRARARRQVERELALIEKLQLEGYFLIVWDIVRFCREQNILVQGRGSAANSAVCYSLGITAVDPVGMDLLFERFLSEERGEWPDIDLDLPSGDQRERAIQYVYQRYGERGAAMTANVITYRGRMAAREMGKVLGFDEDTVGRLSGLVGTWEYKDPDDTLEKQFRYAGFDLRHPRMRKFLELCVAVQDLPRHLGQHSGGMVICQGQLDSVVPLEPASMPGRVVVQWDKEDCADLGIIKVDLLGLGMMAVLEDSIQLIRDHYGVEEDLAHLPADDSEVYAALQQADTVGLFQIESRAQMSCLPRLRPQKFYDIVVQVAIIRPGPIVGKMVNPFLNRRMGREKVTYPHPSLEPVLSRTLGVPLFQEQLLRMAMITAGFSGGEAEELRRAMGFKRSEKRMRDIEVKLRAGMTRNGITPDAQELIIDSITSFALYGFPESHSASFALLAYASAYLKTHYLAAFTAALLNNQPMGFYHPSTIVKDAQRHGLKFLPVDVTKSQWECTVERSMVDGRRPMAEQIDCRLGENGHFRVRLGLRYVRGLREEAGRALLREREQRRFESITDLARRVPELRRTELETLAEVGALNEVADGPMVSEDPQGLKPGEFTDSTARLKPCPSENRELEAGDRELQAGDREFAAGNQKLQASNRELAAGNQKLQASNRELEAGNRKLETGNLKFEAGKLKLHRRDALWQVASASRGEGPLLRKVPEPDTASPLAMMDREERLVADFRGTGLTVGPHPMAYRRAELRAQGIRSAVELESIPNGQFVRAAGCVIARQRPGTAHGFVFLSLEDETGIANAIVTPDLFEQNRLLLVREKFLLVEGVLQNLDNVISVKAQRVLALPITEAVTTSHDFH